MSSHRLAGRPKDGQSCAPGSLYIHKERTDVRFVQFTQRQMKVCVFGAGAIGGHLAGRLAKGGAEVSIIARGAHLAAIQAHGLRVETPSEVIEAHVPASDDPAALGPQDAVIVAVKAPALSSVAASIAPLLDPDTSVIFVMNGIPWWYWQMHGGPQNGRALPLLDPGGALARAVEPRRVMGGVVYSACTVTAPGIVRVESTGGKLVLGELDGVVSPRAEAMAAPLRAGGITVEVSPRIRDAVWAKLLLNLGSGPLGVLGAAAPRDFYAEPACREATRAVLAEAAALAAAMGCVVVPDVEGQIRQGAGSGHKTSILQDLEASQPMEIDALYTVPLQMARAAAVATPMLDLLVGLVRVRARAAGLYAG